MSETQIGAGSVVDDSVLLSYGDGEEPTHVGADAVIRAGSVLYRDVATGDRFHTGHDVIVRAQTVIGDDVLVGTKSIIDGRTDIGSDVSVQSRVYIPADTIIGDNVFLGPAAVLTNDAYPVRTETPLAGPTLEDGVSVGANATILPDVTIGEHAFVAAGAVVTDDVPSDRLAVGAPASTRPLPPALAGPNTL